MTQLQLQSSGKVDSYLEVLRTHLLDVPVEEREWLLQQARARIELALELESAGLVNDADVERVLAKLDDPAALAQRLRAQAPPSPQTTPAGRTAPCRSCRREVSTEALACRQCGAPWPARQAWRGWGYEWNRRPGCWACRSFMWRSAGMRTGSCGSRRGSSPSVSSESGPITIAQFGIGAIFGLGQFVIAPLALGQFALGLAAAGQFGLGLLYGAGQIATGAIKAWGMVKFGNFFGG